MRRFMLFIVCCFSWMAASAMAAIETVPIVPSADGVPLGRFVQVLEDPAGALSVEDALTAIDSMEFTPNKDDHVSRGYSKSTFWLHLSLKNATRQEFSRLLEIPYAVLDYLDIYVYREGQLIDQYALGDKQSFAQRPLRHHHYVIELDFPPRENIDLLMRVRTSSSVQVPMIMWDATTFTEHSQTALLVDGIYFGVLLVMALYNLMLFVSLRQVSYLYYAGYAVGIVVFLAALEGLAFQYLWPNATWWNDQSLVVSLGLTIWLANAMYDRFLQLNKALPRMHMLVGVFNTVVLLWLLATFLLPYREAILGLIVAGLATFVAGTGLGIYRWMHGYQAARFYTLGWIVVIVLGSLFAFNKIGWVERNDFTEYAVQMGVALQVLLFSMALSDRLNTEKRLRFEAQMQALQHERASRQAQEQALKHEKKAREAQEKALKSQQKAAETLEQRVRERTAELEMANQRLQETSVTDSLTGLKNRRHFDHTFHLECKRMAREHIPLAALLMDIDHFKVINDSHGHLVGDDCLSSIADILSQSIHRDTDTLARYGGEEFVALLPYTDAEGALNVAERLRRRVEAAWFSAEGARIRLTISVGVAVVQPDAADQVDNLLDRADQALYASKSTGRNCVTLHDAEMVI